MAKPLRLLIIEDSEFDAKIMVNVLRTGGLDPVYERVETAEAMKEALERVAWEVILSDYNLPNFSAPEALQILKDSGRDIPFIIISGGIGEDIAVSAMKSGAHDYLMKGQLARLVVAVEREMREANTRSIRRDVEEALKENELRYRLLWENSIDAVLLMDMDGEINFANPAVEEIFGYQPAELLGEKMSILQPPQADIPGISEPPSSVDPISSRSNRKLIESLGLRKDATVISIEIAFSRMELHGNRLQVAFIRDITERKRAEEELHEHEEQFRVVHDIQQWMFPKSAPRLPGFDIAGASFPAEAAGGDYYDFLPMLSSRLGLVIADVTGHGVGPALLMAETRAYLRLLAKNRVDVGNILTRANGVLAEDLSYERYITMLLVSIDPTRRALVYSSAGHPDGLVLDSDGRVKRVLGRMGVPLGVRPDTVFPSAPETPLVPGDIVLILTDGFEEAMNAKNEFFGEERICRLVDQNRNKSSRDILGILYQTVRDFSDHEPQSDDLTGIVMKVLEDPTA